MTGSHYRFGPFVVDRARYRVLRDDAAVELTPKLLDLLLHLVEHAGALSLRQGQWKLIEPSAGQKVNRNTNTETGSDPAGQLYDLAADLGETKNVASAHPERVKAMSALLQKLREQGRSR